MVVEDIAADDNAARKLAAIHKPEVRVNPVLVFQPGPDDKAWLKEQRRSAACIILPPAYRDNGFKISCDILAPRPSHARVEAEALVKQRGAALADGVFDGVNQHARTGVAEVLAGAFGIVTPVEINIGGR